MASILQLKPVQKVNGEVTIPGSKSVSNRALLLSAQAEGITHLHNVLISDDTHYMRQALKNLGIDITQADTNGHFIVQGKGGVLCEEGDYELYLGNAGTAMRPLCAALCAAKGKFVLTGDPRMKERPIKHLVDALLQVGGDITYLESRGFPPLQILGKGLEGGRVQIDGSLSSQYLTALLMAAPLSQKGMQIDIVGELVSKPYIDITIELMRRFGIDVEHEHYSRFFVPHGVYRSPGEYMVEGDASSASYFLAAAAIKGGKVKVFGIDKHSIQGDIAFVHVLEKMGAKVEWGDGYIAVSRGELHGVDMDFNHIPDAAMTIATTALFAKGKTVLRNIYNWRIKETDRLHAMATELQKVGATVEEGRDYLAITPPQTFRHATIDTYDDHRMAMAFSLLALSPASVSIHDPGCSAKTFPNYFELFDSICIT